MAVFAAKTPSQTTKNRVSGVLGDLSDSLLGPLVPLIIPLSHNRSIVYFSPSVVISPTKTRYGNRGYFANKKQPPYGLNHSEVALHPHKNYASSFFLLLSSF